MKPIRVSKSNPCPICKKPDWCMIGDDAVFCMRVQSGKSVQFADGSRAFLHSLGTTSRTEYHRPEPERPIIHCEQIMERWRDQYPQDTGLLASNLGVSKTSLDVLGCWRSPYPGAWAFPMRVGDNTMVGIRIRHLDGKKWAERGSRQGLFLPQMDATPTALVCEGPTDTAAAITMGYFAIGRPSCMGGTGDLRAAIHRLGIKRLIICADVDSDHRRENGDHYNPGIDGAVALSETVGVTNCIATLPAKDMREFVKSGGSMHIMESIVSTLIWRKANA